MKQQTAVEWQFEQLFNSFEKFNNGECTFNDFLKRNLEIRKQAKEMEKQQAVEFGYDIADYLACGVLSKKAIEDRYNEFLNSEEDESKTD
jgi:hypothetical protein